MLKRKFYDYDEHSRVGAKHGEFVSDEICDRFSVLGDVDQITTKLRELESIGVDHFSIYLMTHSQEETLAAYGEHVIPQFTGRGGIATSESSRAGAPSRPAGSADASSCGRRPASSPSGSWSSSTRGRGRRSWSWRRAPATPGFSPPTALGPGGRLLSTDGAPEMVEAARRRAAELGVTNVEFGVVDAAAIDLPDASVDGILCRWGLMLVPQVATAFREVARVLRPGGRAAVAVWAEPDRNDWLTAHGRAALQLGLIERPPPDAPGPFRLAAEGALEELFTAAGLVATVEDVQLTWRASSLDEWWETTRDLSRMINDLLASITPEQAAAVRAGASERLARYVGADGAVAVPSVTRVALASKPASAT